TTAPALTTTTRTTRPNRAIDLAGRLVVAPALLIAPFVAIDRAAAACDPPSPVSGQTVTCTDTTGSPNVPVGFGTRDDTGNTYNVQPGASVTGKDEGLLFRDGTVRNFGTIKAGDDGLAIAALTKADVTNFAGGTIQAGAGGTGIFTFGTANVKNFGTI